MDSPERWVLLVKYCDVNGKQTVRVISPTKWNLGRLHALCLCREEPREFDPDRLDVIKIVDANKVQAPVDIALIEGVEGVKKCSRKACQKAIRLDRPYFSIDNQKPDPARSYCVSCGKRIIRFSPELDYEVINDPRRKRR